MNVGLEQNAAIGNEKLRRQKIGQEISQTRKDRANRRLEVIQSLLEGGNQFYLDRASLAETIRNNDLDYAASMADGGGGSGGSSSGSKSTLTPRRGVSVLEKVYGTEARTEPPGRKRRDQMIGELVNRGYRYENAVAAVNRYVTKYL
jgi:hypothetical protein